MTRDEAKALLSKTPERVVKTFYNRSTKLVDALYTLIPDFEYGCWDYKTYAEVLRWVERQESTTVEQSWEEKADELAKAFVDALEVDENDPDCSKRDAKLLAGDTSDYRKESKTMT